MTMTRRDFLTTLLATGGLLASAPSQALKLDKDSRIFNPCGKLSAALRKHEFTEAGFAGLNAEDVWDCHAHLLGLGESGGGAWVTPKMQSFWRVRLYAQYRFYLNAACVDPDSGNVDRDYVNRITALMDDFPAGYRAMIMAFDRTHDQAGKVQLEQSAFYMPNTYAGGIAQANPARFMWTASVHPYRDDALAELARVAEAGAVAIKWLPPAMGIDPAAARCDAFYDAMVKHNLVLLTHGGEEKAVEGAHQPKNGNVLKLRRPLDRGVRVVVAHCAGLGTDVDLDRGEDGPEVECFTLFERLMATKAYEGRVFGDVSATTQTNRIATLARILAHREWDGRLVNGSDYPLPGVFPLISVDEITEHGWLKPEVGVHLKKVRESNPILFDFLLKRHLEINGTKFSAATFETARVFRRTPSAPSKA